jgi:hypothetical protein
MEKKLEIPENYIPIKDVSERMDICRQCEFYNPMLSRCRICGCIMKLKVKLPGTKCPLNKW